MNEMIYSANRLIPPQRLAEGQHEGFTYYILNLGTHPCAYVDVSNTSLHGSDYDDIDVTCHGGLTFASDNLYTVETTGWFIGWDYAHFGDFVGFELDFPTYLRPYGRMWTTEEIVDECKSVIDQIKKIVSEGEKCTE